MNCSRPLLLVPLMVLWAAPALALPKTLVFTGAISDEKGTPLGGIFWCRFALHRSRSEEKLLWSEELYVAADRGSYQVELGKERPIPQALDLEGLFLSVQVDGAEVQRVQVTPAMLGRRAPPEGEAGGAPGGCQECAQAEDSQRLGGMTVKQLLEQVARRQMEVGTTVHFTDSVGGADGEPFRLSCPPGFVVTGIKGLAGQQVTNLQLVCSPLESK